MSYNTDKYLVQLRTVGKQLKDIYENAQSDVTLTSDQQCAIMASIIRSVDALVITIEDISHAIYDNHRP